MASRISVTLSTLAAAGLISGCGGSDGNKEEIKVGEQFKATVSVDDTDVLEKNFVAYGVTSDGQLVTDPGAKRIEGAMIPLLDSVKVLDAAYQVQQSSTPQSAPATQQFFSTLWQHMAAHYGEKDAGKILAHIADLDASIQDIESDFLKSGLTMAEYVDFYEALDEFHQLGQNNNEEFDVMRFLQVTGLNQKGLLTTLGVRNLSWRNLLATMESRGDNFNTLSFRYGSEYTAGHIGEFLDGYLPRTGLQALAGNAPSYLDIAKFAWQFIKDNRPVVAAQGAYTHVLHAKDPDPLNYGMARSASTPVVGYRTAGVFNWPTQTETRFKLSGYYDARHASIRGHWMPSVSFDVVKASAIFSWHLNASANIAHVANIGSVDEPVPELPILVSLNISGVFQNFLETFQFKANGKTGFVHLKP